VRPLCHRYETAHDGKNRASCRCRMSPELTTDVLPVRLVGVDSPFAFVGSGTKRGGFRVSGVGFFGLLNHETRKPSSSAKRLPALTACAFSAFPCRVRRVHPAPGFVIGATSMVAACLSDSLQPAGRPSCRRLRRHPVSASLSQFTTVVADLVGIQPKRVAGIPARQRKRPSRAGRAS